MPTRSKCIRPRGAFVVTNHYLDRHRVHCAGVVSGTLRYDDFMGGWQVNARNVLPIDRVIEKRARSILIDVAPNGQGQRLLTRL